MEGTLAVMPKTDYDDACNAIREKDGTTALIKSGEMGAKIRAISNASYPEQYAKEINFSLAQFPAGYKLELKLPKLERWVGNFSNCRGLEEIRIINANPKNVSATFRDSAEIKIIDFSNSVLSVGNYNRFVQGCHSLEKIIGTFDGITADGLFTFFGCDNLKEVRFAPFGITTAISFESSPLLSDETIHSIIDGLINLSGQSTKTIKLNSKIVLSDSQKAAITSKNWTLVQ